MSLNKTLVFIVCMLFFLQPGHAQDPEPIKTPVVSYEIENYRAVGDFGNTDPALPAWISTAYLQRNLGKSIHAQRQDFQKHNRHSVQSMKQINLKQNYKMLEIHNQSAFYFRPDWAGYLYKNDVITGYFLIEPLVIHDSQRDSFESQPFFQLIYQQPQASDWLPLDLPEGCLFTLYKVPHAADQIEIYGILEIPGGYKALILEAFFPGSLSPQVKPWMQQQLNAMIRNIKSYLNETGAL